MPEVKALRDRIDKIDREIVKLLEKRIEIVREIGRLKRDTGAEIFDPERERDVLRNVSNSTRLDKRFVMDMFRLIMEYCKNEEEKG